MSGFDRRQFNIGAGAALTATILGAGGASAQAWPSQDIHIISGNPPGSGGDIIVRFFAEKLRPLLGRTVVVENRVGAMSAIAIQYTARAKPDGHIIYIASGSVIASVMHLLKQPPVDVIKQIQFISPISRSTMMLVVAPTSPYKDFRELTAAVQAKGEKASYGYSGAIAKVIGAMYVDTAKLKAVEVSYKTGDDFMNDLAAGNVDFAIADHVQATSQARAGRLRILAVGSDKRLLLAPEIPTFTEFGYPIDIKTWWSVSVPMGVPRSIVEQLNGYVQQVVRSDEAKTFLNNIGTDPWSLSPDESQVYLEQQVKDWRNYMQIAKIEPQ